MEPRASAGVSSGNRPRGHAPHRLPRKRGRDRVLSPHGSVGERFKRKGRMVGFPGEHLDAVDFQDRLRGRAFEFRFSAPKFFVKPSPARVIVLAAPVDPKVLGRSFGTGWYPWVSPRSETG